MKKLNRLLFWFKVKNLIISLFELSIIFLIAYAFDKWFEMSIFVITYNLIRGDFTLAIHGEDFVNSHNKAIILCRFITFIVQLISIIFLINIDVSKFLNTFLACFLGVINYLFKYYLERTLNLEFKIRNINTLKLLCENAKLSEQATKRMYMRYIEKKSIKEIANIEMVEEITIMQSIRRSRKKLNI